MASVRIKRISLSYNGRKIVQDIRASPSSFINFGAIARARTPIRIDTHTALLWSTANHKWTTKQTKKKPNAIRNEKKKQKKIDAKAWLFASARALCHISTFQKGNAVGLAGVYRNDNKLHLLTITKSHPAHLMGLDMETITKYKKKKKKNTEQKDRKNTLTHTNISLIDDTSRSAKRKLDLIYVFIAFISVWRDCFSFLV